MLSNKEFQKLNDEAYEYAKREYEEVQYDKEYSQKEAIALGAFNDDAIADVINQHLEEEQYMNDLHNQLGAGGITVFASPGPLSWQGKLLYSPLIAYNWLRSFGKK
ncbi:MAG: hypothetical protein P794_03830 [Epsilonproteobacteria bacterium (ex Lamellibrachia satsuma)]|nr:MAG: hypothetical protein P794_03830 [Epsilonproteobacteria bacterium (ex Lamellibrachia satsuma)]